jgi:N-acetylglucosaminyldiphosphoundecaprenol N-acetyl-beta-D-mannosaminyltransferase
MRFNTVEILGIPVCINSQREILEFLEKAMLLPEKKGNFGKQETLNPVTIVTPNPEQVMLARGNGKFLKLIKEADLAIPDGIGLVWAARLLGLSGPAERISGSDLMQDLAKVAQKQGVRIGLIGGKPGVALKALECLRKNHPKLEGAAFDGPEILIMNQDLRIKIYESNNSASEWDKRDKGQKAKSRVVGDILQWIRKNRLGVVFVGMGAPKQEWLMHEVVETMRQNSSWFMVHGPRNKLLNNKNMNYEQRTINQKLILMSVGGAFDMIAGLTPRAPVWVREMGLEWLWRLVREPWRIKRQFKLGEFGFLVVKQALLNRVINSDSKISIL